MGTPLQVVKKEAQWLFDEDLQGQGGENSVKLQTTNPNSI